MLRVIAFSDPRWHPHVVGVSDREVVDGSISMDFVDGLDTAHRRADRYPAAMPVVDVSRIVTAASRAMPRPAPTTARAPELRARDTSWSH